jgi:hypothetical protein
LYSHACSRSQKVQGHEYAGGGTIASLHTERSSTGSLVEVGNCGEDDCCTNGVALVVVVVVADAVAAVVGVIDDFSRLPDESAASKGPPEACDT